MSAPLAVLAVITLIVSGTAVSQDQPEDFGVPTGSQISASIRIWDPTRGVRQWDPSGSVKVVEATSTDGDETVLSLDTDILFEFGEAKLPKSAPDRISDLLADVPEGAKVSVIGHTDNIGEADFNQDLSERRAQAVARVLSNTRADLDLKVEGRGDTEPVSSNSEPEGRQDNRRVEVRYSD